MQLPLATAVNRARNDTAGGNDWLRPCRLASFGIHRGCTLFAAMMEDCCLTAVRRSPMTHTWGHVRLFKMYNIRSHAGIDTHVKTSIACCSATPMTRGVALRRPQKTIGSTYGNTYWEHVWQCSKWGTGTPSYSTLKAISV
jgi:hypothetical protein